ncbi:MAG: hypothetical protein L0229_21555 [Blastocatellia bacterium]|nr:hypothetical protein [Blastocatellia bacterium]
MRYDEDTEKQIARYLLGDMGEGERLRFEEGCFADDDSLEELESARDELVDSYIHGDLSDKERRQFEDYFLSYPIHRRKLQLARAMTEVLAGSPPVESAVRHSSRQSLLSLMKGRNRALILAMALILLALAGYLIARAVLQMQKPASQEEALADKNTNEAPDRKGAQPRIITFAPTPAIGGRDKVSGEDSNLMIAQDVDWVHLVIARPDARYRDCRALISVVAGERIWTENLPGAESLMPEDKITLRVPAHLFIDQDYVLEITGREGNGEAQSVNHYRFRVVRE